MASAGKTVTRLAESQESAWQSYVADHSLATPFHTLAWKRSVERGFDYDAAYRLVRDEEGEIAAAVPAFDCAGPVRRVTVNPFCEYGFPLVAPGVEATSVLAPLRDLAGGRSTVMLKDADWTGVVGYNELGFGGVQTGRARRVALPDSFDALVDHVFDRTLRKNVVTARDNGLEVRTTRDVDDFYPLYIETMRRRGSPQFPRSFLAGLLDEFGQAAELLIAVTDEKPVAGLLSLDQAGTRHLFLNGSRQRHLDDRPNDLLYWRAIERACQRGFDRVDFGRSEAGSGVDRFKARFGGETTPLTTLVAPPHRAGTGSVSSLRRLEPLARQLSPLITHPAVGPRLKEWIHE